MLITCFAEQQLRAKRLIGLPPVPRGRRIKG
jgi:hypothetical protein